MKEKGNTDGIETQEEETKERERENFNNHGTMAVMNLCI